MNHNSHPIIKQQYGIFLSSTNDPEVRKFRIAAREVIEEDEFRERWYAKEMDQFTPSRDSSLEECSKLVLSCAVYIGILGPFYGSVNENVDLSYTEFEYNVALDAGREIGIFILPDNILSSSLPSIIVNQGDLLKRQQAFKDKLNTEHMTRSVSSIEDFKTKLRDYIRQKLNSLSFEKTKPHIKEKTTFLGIESFDRQPIPHQYSLNDLDKHLITQYLSSQMAISALDERDIINITELEHLKLLGFLDNDNQITLGMFLCFASHKHLVHKFGACSLHMVVYSGTTADSRVIYKREVEDNLLNLHQRGMKFFRTDARLQRMGEVGSSERDELEIPTVALREALGNALVHRDYSLQQFREQPTRLEVYRDRVEIISFGGLVEGISEEQLNNNPETIVSIRRNPIIAKIFMYMQLVELGGSGVNRMYNVVQQAGMPLPRISEHKENGTVRVTFYRVGSTTENMKGQYVFMSYSRDDSAMMRRIKGDLQDAGVNVWTDEGIEVGTPNWQLAIEKAIENASAMLVVMTPSAKQSHWVREEMVYATFHQKPVYMLHCRGEYKQIALLGFAVAQTIDLRDEASYPSRIQQLTVHLSEFIDNESMLTDTTDKLTLKQITSPQDITATREAENPTAFMPATIPTGELHQLIVRSGKEFTSQVTFDLQDTFITIGRDKTNTIVIDDTGVRSQHCQIIYTIDGFLLRDLGSANGTHVNNEQVTIRILKPKDEIQLGKVTFLYRKLQKQ